MWQTTGEQFIDQYARDPERVCLTLLHSGQVDRPVRYRELMQSAAGYALALEKAGIRPGEVVILILPHGLDLISAFWGSILHGSIPSIMPFLTEKLLPDRYRRDLGALVSVTRPAAVVTYPEFVEEVRAAVMDRGADGTESPVRTVLLCSDIRPVLDLPFDHVGGRKRAAGTASRPITPLNAAGAASCARTASSLRNKVLQAPLDAAGEIVLLQHSSGTTGLQKGVAITHQALHNQLDCYGRVINLSSDDVIVSWLPLYHDMGLIAGFLMPVLMGVPLVLMSPFDWVRDPASLLWAVTRYRGTLSWLPNFAYNFCAQKIRDSQLEGIDLSTWRAVINCSEPMFAQSFRLFSERFAPYGLREGTLATSYAMAENVFGVTQGGIDGPVTVDEVDAIRLQKDRVAFPAGEKKMVERLAALEQPGREHPTAKLLSCGRPIQGTRVKVLDAQGRALPERHIGELAVQSNCMLAGYYNRPDETALAFMDGWYLTGDYGYMADGEVYVTGRKKDLIIVGGRNIFPQDIEAVANEVPGVHPGRSVAFGIYNESLGTEEVALVAEVDLPEEQICEDEACLEIEDALRLAVNQNTTVALRYIKLVGPHWLIKTSSGKIARGANREKFLKEYQ